MLEAAPLPCYFFF